MLSCLRLMCARRFRNTPTKLTTVRQRHELLFANRQPNPDAVIVNRVFQNI